MYNKINADEDYKLAVETSQRFRGGGTEIQVKNWGAKAPSSAALAKISESVSIKVALFSLSMFRYSLHSSTRQNTASIVLFLDPPETTASIPHRIKVSISVNPWVFHELPIKHSSSNCCPLPGTTFPETFRVAEKSYGLE